MKTHSKKINIVLCLICFFSSMLCGYSQISSGKPVISSKDSYVRDGIHENTVYQDTLLYVKPASTNFDRKIFLSFNLPFVPDDENIISATLRLRVAYHQDVSAAVTHELREVDDDSWSEDSITANNQPIIAGIIDQSSSIGAANSYVEFDVKSYVQSQLSNNDNQISLAVVGQGNQSGYVPAVAYYSKESTRKEGVAAKDRPELIIIKQTTRTVPNTFYVSSGPEGDDGNSGTSIASPWKTLDKVNNTIFMPGDQILFKSGSVWQGQLNITNSGNETNPIIYDSYGNGSRPIINGDGIALLKTYTGAIYIYNAEYFSINNLEITNQNANNPSGERNDYLWGIYALKNNAAAARNIVISNCYIHHVNGNASGKKTGGIYITADKSNGNDQKGWYDDLKIINNIIEYTGGLGIGTQSPYSRVDDRPFTGKRRPFMNVLIKGNKIDHTGRNNIIIRVSDDAVVEHNTLARSSRNPDETGHSIFPFNCIGVKIQYNEAYGNVGSDGDKDRGGFDADYRCYYTKIQYNFSHDNFWGFGIMREGPNVGVIIRYNISQNDKKLIYYYGFQSDQRMKTATVYNNTHYISADNTSIFGQGSYADREALKTNYYNNIFYFEGENAVIGKIDSVKVNGNKVPSVKFENNLFYNIPLPQDGMNNIAVDPLLVDPSTPVENIDWSNYPNILEGFFLQPSSPAINAGRVVENNGGQDFWGNPLYNGNPDIGAHEFSGVIESLPVNADAFVRNGTYASTNYGSANVLTVKEGSTDWTRESYLKFDLTNISGVITNATLKMVPADSNNDISNINYLVKPVANDSWAENMINWNNRPSVGSTPIDSKPGSFLPIEWDVTSYAESQRTLDGTMSLNMVASSAFNFAKLDFYSKEGAGINDNLKPVLKVTYSPATSSARYSANSNTLIFEQNEHFVSEKIFPNPVSNTLVIESNYRIESLQVFNVAGHLVDSKKINERYHSGHTEIDVEDLPSGLYFVSFKNEDGNMISKSFIKKN